MFLVILLLPLQGQNRDEISKRKNELERLKKEIKQLDLQLQQTLKQEKANLSAIENYEKQIGLLSKIIRNLEQEELEISQKVRQKELELRSAERELRDLMIDYERNIVNLYKSQRKHPLELIFSSANVNQALIRYKYLEKFTEDRKRRIHLINLKSKEVEKERAELSHILQKKEKVKQEKQSESNLLNKKIQKNRTYVAELKRNKENILRDIQRKRESANRIADLINKLIEQKKREDEERKRLEEKIRKEKQAKVDSKPISEARKPAKSITPSISPITSVENVSNYPLFSTYKGRLTWPAEGRIVNKFGEQLNPQLRTVTMNFGVDIAVSYGSPVRAVADGRVSIIYWLPGYGNIIILTHSEDFRTVYAYLSEILVVEGQIVNRGSIIAKSGESLSGEMLHFQIWRGREKQNPELWLAVR